MQDVDQLAVAAESRLREALEWFAGMRSAIRRGDFRVAQDRAAGARRDAYQATRQLASLVGECELRQQYPEQPEERGALSADDIRDLPLGTPYWCLKVQTPIMPASGFYYYATCDEAQRAAMESLKTDRSVVQVAQMVREAESSR